MYQKSFYITERIGNNALSYNQRQNKKLYVPSIKKISSFDEIQLTPNPSLDKRGEHKIVFEDYDFDDILQSCTGLKNFYEMTWKGKPMYLFDNHNHAYYFFYLARHQGYITDGATLFHVDEHADMRDPGRYLMKPDSLDMRQVFKYTNFSEVNVGNYIIPAQKEGLLGDVVQIRNEKNLLDYLENPLPQSLPPREREEISLSPSGRKYPKGDRGNNIILNLDLDFFEPELDFIDYDLKKKVILDMAEKADFITVATSPFFINQELAIKVFKDLFEH